MQILSPVKTSFLKEFLLKFMGLTCSSMFSLFLGIASANGVHVPNIDLIREHRVMGHALKLDHTVTKIKLIRI